MNAVGSAEIFEFGGFRLDLQDLSLWRLEQEGPVAVSFGRRPRQVLALLLEAYPALVERRTLLEKLWPPGADPNNLDMQIARLRREIDPNDCIIKTVYAEGFRIGVPVRRVQDAVTPPPMSIIVLPFGDLSEGKKQQHFAYGITDDLTTDLSRIEGMFVISRSTSDTFAEMGLGAKQICQEVRVRYALEGSVQRSGNRVRVNVQLIDAESDRHLWAERFDRDTSDLFALQNEITSRIAITLNAELVNAEAARPTKHPDALDYIFRGRAVLAGRPPSAENCAEAIGLFERALMVDPGSAGAKCWLAIVLGNRLLDFPAHASNGDLDRAETLAAKAVAASPRSSLAHFAKGQVLRVQKRYEEAITEYETVLASNRNWVGAIFALGWCKFHTGSIEEIIPLLEQIIRLSPRDPYIGIWYGRIGIAHLLQSRFDEAIVWLEKARSAIPSRPWTRSSLAVAYALKGDTELAAAEIAEARRLSPDGRYSSIARLKEVGYLGVPKIRELFERIYLTGYRIAGVPEE
jgi:TolB-like protein